MALPVTGQAQGLVQAIPQKSGSPAAVSVGWNNELVKSDLMPRFAYLGLAGSIFSAATAGGGVQLAATHLFSTAIGTFTPILAVYNPLTNTKNLIVLSVLCGLTAAPLATITQTGGFLFVVGAGQSISNAQTATPVSHSTLKAAGSSAIGITNAVLTGAVGNPTVLRLLGAPAEVVTATANVSAVTIDPTLEEIAGGIIIPPGGYLAIANGISNAVAGHLVTASLTWTELPA